MANDIAKAYVQIIPSAEGVGTSLTSIVGSASTTAGLSGGTLLGNGVLSSMKGVLTGVGITAAVAGVVNALKACVSEASDFDAGMSQVAATMGTTTDEITELSDFAKEMGRTTAFSATEAAAGLNTLALAGLDADEQMEVLPNVLNLASAGCIDLDDAASYVTGTLKGFGDSMDNAEYYTDLMAKGATLANTDVDDLGEALSSSAATANSYGQEADSVTVALLRLAEQNVTGSDAATALNRAMADLYTPTDAAKGAMEELGVACYDANGNARDFNDIVDDLDDALSGYDAETQNAYKDTIFTTRGLQAFNKMTASSTETVDGFKEGLADCAGSAMQQAETQLDNLKGDVTLFKSAMSGAKIAIGEALTPMLRGITEFGTSCVTAFTDIITGERTIPEVFNDACNSIMQRVYGEDWNGIGSFIKDHMLAPIGEIASGAWDKVTTFCGNIKQKIQETDWNDVGSQISEKITNGLEKLREGAQQVEELRQAMWEKIQSIDWHEVGAQVGELISNGIEKISDGLQTVQGWCQDVISWIGNIDWHNVGVQVGEFIANGVQNISQGLQHVGQFCVDVAQKIKETDWKQVGKDLIDKIGNGLQNFQTALTSIGNFAKGIWDKMKEKDWKELGHNIIDGIGSGIQNFAEVVSGAVENFGSGLVQGFKNVFGIGSPSTVMRDEIGQPIVEGVAAGMEDMPSEMDSTLSETLGVVDSFSAEASTSANGVGEQITAGVVDGLNPMPSAVDSSLTATLNNTKNWGKSTVSTASDAASSTLKAVDSEFKNIPDTVNSPLTNAMSDTTSWGANEKASASDTAKSFVNNVKSGLSSIGDTVSAQLAKATSQVESWQTMMKTKATAIGTTFMNNVVNAMSGLASQIASVLSNALSTVNSYSSQMTSAGTTLGSNLVQGMINGINSKSSSLYSTISSVVSTAVSKANSAAGTGSPSRYLAWTGRMMDEGLALGLSDYAYKVDNAMNDVMSIVDAKGSMEFNGNAYGGTGTNGRTINITQNIYSQAQTAAQLMRQCRREAQRAVMQGV